MKIALGRAGAGSVIGAVYPGLATFVRSCVIFTMIKSLLAALFLLTLGCARPGWAAEPPNLPCGDPAFLPAPPVGAPPAIAAWSGNDLGSKWQPPVCTGWQAEPAR